MGTSLNHWKLSKKVEGGSILSASSLIQSGSRICTCPIYQVQEFTRFPNSQRSAWISFFLRREVFLFVPLWIHQPNYYKQAQLRQTVSTIFQLTLYWKHLGQDVFTPPLPSILLFPLPNLKQARWKKNHVQQTIHFFQVTTVRHVKWIDVARSRTEANFTCLFSPYWAAKSVLDRKWLMMRSTFVCQCGMLFNPPSIVQIFAWNQYVLWILLLMMIRAFPGMFSLLPSVI